MNHDDDDTGDMAAYGLAGLSGYALDDSEDVQARGDLIDNWVRLRDMLFGHITLGDA